MRALLSVLLVGMLSSGAALADATAETATALKHIYLAANADKLADAHANLHRAVNCLVGPKDSLFDAHTTNPCAKSGKGAIADTSDAEERKHLKDAVEMAEMGIASSDLNKATMLATGAAAAVLASQKRQPHS